jgi:hypothetical protein
LKGTGFTGCGKTHPERQESSGHDFSRAAKSPRKLGALAVKFQQVVVHSVKNWDADVAKQEQSQETEWTITIMLD